jgi:hypothetical protein
MPALTVLGLVIGIVVFVILVVSVAAWWVAAIIGLGVLLVCTLADGLIQWGRVNPNKSGAYG